MKSLLTLLITLSLLWGNQRSQVHMGTLISVEINDQNLSDELFTLFKDLDNRLSTYKSDSEISRLNRDYELNISEVTRKVLERSIQINTMSEGAFDITIGSLTHGTYHFGYTNEHLPSTIELQNGEKLVGSNRIFLRGNNVRLLPGTVIDLGGIGKGYAVDLAIEKLHREDVKKAIIAASGDIGCLGKCIIEIQDPFHPNRTRGTITSSLSRLAVSTSGNYERYIKNKTHNHLINPKTGLSQQVYASITLIDNKDNTRLDALATAISVMEEKKALLMLKKLKIGYVLIHNDGTVKTNTMPEGITLQLLP